MIFLGMQKRLFVSMFVLCVMNTAIANIPDLSWQPSGNKAGIDLYHREISGSDIIELRGIGVIDQPLWKVAATMLDTERAPEWMDSLEESIVVRRIDLNTYIEYNHIGTPFFLKDRDFVSLVKISVDPKNKTFSMAYTPSADAFGSEKHIRGEINPAVFYLTAIDKDHTRLTGEVHCDPKGSIPKWLVNFFQKDWAYETITALRKQTAKEDVRIPAQFADVLEPTLAF